ncbi:hypothetical protein BGLA2_1380032 [Burkholderia gladioli]|nr:hypothetical protein BGLA2_1380032 [Burkholderia gladioli]
MRSPGHTPRLNRRAIFARKWAIAFGNDSVSRKTSSECTTSCARKCSRPHAEPTAHFVGNLHLGQGSAEPMKYGDTETGIFQQDGQYLLHCTSGVDAKGLAAELSAPSHDGIEYFPLHRQARFETVGAVHSDFADCHRIFHLLEQLRELLRALLDQFWMQSWGNKHARDVTKDL